MGQQLDNSEKSSHTDNIFYRAEKLREKSFYQEALRLFKKALQENTRKQDRERMFYCMLSLGDTYRMVGNFELASENYADAIKIANKTKSPVMVADAKVGLGLSLRAQGKWAEAIKLIRESKITYKQNNDRQGIAFTLWAEAGTLRIKGDIKGAIKTFRESLKIFKSLGDLHGVGYCLCGLGGTSRIAGLFRDSLKYYLSANKLFLNLKDTFGKAYSYCGIGNAYRMLKDYRNAFAYFTKATRVYKKIGDKVSYAYTLWGLSTAHKMIGELKKAHTGFIRAKNLFKKTKDPRGIIYCRLGFGEIALLSGRKGSARGHLLTAQAEAKENKFAVEKCHADILISFMNETNSSPSHFGKRELSGFYGNIDNTCYNRLGLKLKFRELPLNIP